MKDIESSCSTKLLFKFLPLKLFLQEKKKLPIVSCNVKKLIITINTDNKW